MFIRIRITNRKFGSDRNNYLLFDDFVTPTATRHLKNEYKATDQIEKSWHDLRHTSCTNVAGRVFGDIMTPKAILGHSASAIERYMHRYEKKKKWLLENSPQNQNSIKCANFFPRAQLLRFFLKTQHLQTELNTYGIPNLEPHARLICKTILE